MSEHQHNDASVPEILRTLTALINEKGWRGERVAIALALLLRQSCRTRTGTYQEISTRADQVAGIIRASALRQ